MWRSVRTVAVVAVVASGSPVGDTAEITAMGEAWSADLDHDLQVTAVPLP